MAEAERAGAEAGDRAAGAERRVGDLGAIKCLEPIAGGIPERNQAANAPVIGERLRLGDNLDLGSFQPGRQSVQRRRIGNLPAEEALAFRHRAVDDNALLAVVHAECEQGRTALDCLQADQSGPELPPVVESA